MSTRKEFVKNISTNSGLEMEEAAEIFSEIVEELKKINLDEISSDKRHEIMPLIKLCFPSDTEIDKENYDYFIEMILANNK